MAQVKLKSIALLTGGIFVLLFFHFVPVGLGGVTIVGKSNQVTVAEVIEENKGIAAETNQSGFESKVKRATVKGMISGSFDTRFYVVRAKTTYAKNQNGMVSIHRKAGTERLLFIKP